MTSDARYRKACDFLDTTINFWDLTGFDGRSDDDRRDARSYLGAMACLDVALACCDQDVMDALTAAITNSAAYAGSIANDQTSVDLAR